MLIKSSICIPLLINLVDFCLLRRLSTMRKNILLYVVPRFHSNEMCTNSSRKCIFAGFLDVRLLRQGNTAPKTFHQVFCLVIYDEITRTLREGVNLNFEGHTFM